MPSPPSLCLNLFVALRIHRRRLPPRGSYEIVWHVRIHATQRGAPSMNKAAQIKTARHIMLGIPAAKAKR